MIEPLGHVSSGLRRIAARASTVVDSKGECAVFLSLQTRNAYALTRTDPDWRTAPTRNSKHLVGVYQPIAGKDAIAKWVLDDLLAHMGAN